MTLCGLTLAPAFIKYSIVSTETPIRCPSYFLFSSRGVSDVDGCRHLTYVDLELAHRALPDIYGPGTPFSRLGGTADVRNVNVATTKGDSYLEIVAHRIFWFLLSFMCLDNEITKTDDCGHDKHSKTNWTAYLSHRCNKA